MSVVVVVVFFERPPQEVNPLVTGKQCNNLLLVNTAIEGDNLFYQVGEALQPSLLGQSFQRLSLAFVPVRGATDQVSDLRHGLACDTTFLPDW